MTVIAKQSGSTLVTWSTSQGTTIAMLERGTLTAEQTFKSAEDGNATRTWLVRFGGFVPMLIGFSLIFKPLSVVADVIPFIGNIVGWGAGFAAFALAAPLSLATIAVAWIFYRPAQGVTLLVVSVAVFAAMFVAARRRRKA